MTSRSNILARLRRGRREFGSVVLALFAAGSIAANALPCAAMINSATEASTGPNAVHGPTEALLRTADHVHAGTHDHSRGHTLGHAEASDAAAGSPAQDSATSVGHERHAEQHPLGHCPHCPVSGPASAHASGAHSFCSSNDGVAAAQSQAIHQALTHFIALPAWQDPWPPPLTSSPSRRFARAGAAVCSSIALNLRHCVLLI